MDGAARVDLGSPGGQTSSAARREDTETEGFIPLGMDEDSRTRAALGDEPPLLADGGSGPPDRREVSARWLLGTFMTGVTSSVLMGVALSAALDGREQLATPPEIAQPIEIDDPSEEATKRSRLVPPRTFGGALDRRRMEVSTVIRSDDRDVVRTVPFVHMTMALAAGHTTQRDYPDFDPLAVVAEEGAARTARTGLIYGAKVESEVSLRSVAFPMETAEFEERSALSTAEVEQVVRDTGAILTEGDIQVAALHYIDPQRFGGDTFSAQALSSAYGVRVLQENISVAPREHRERGDSEFAEDVIVFNTEQTIVDAFGQSGYEGEEASAMAGAIEKRMDSSTLAAGTVLRLGIETNGDDETRIVRGSVYVEDSHLHTVAVDDRGQFVPASEPEPIPELLAALDENAQPVHVRGDLPRAYDGIYRAAYSYGLTSGMTKRLIRLLAADVDLQSRLEPSDRIEVFFSEPGPEDKATEDSEFMFVRASFDGETRTFYRFQLEDGSVDYFTADGESARRFLLRNPVPNGSFRSGFGMRRHPILGDNRMHTGVDWAAPSGTPIIAAGDGVVESAGWKGGYGRQTVIRHNNGYKTSYNHQSSIANDVTPGARIRQGQVIGQVGASGLATGAHLHYELLVNDTKVDPMRVRLPVDKALEGEQLEAFEHERKRIDALIEDAEDEPIDVANR